MEPYRIRIQPISAFGTRPLGDTLFGQLCWAVRNRHGEERLINLLDGYTQGRPFAVVSDAVPSGYLPRPALPGHWFDMENGCDRKAVKKRAWLPVDQFNVPVKEWLAHCKTPAEIPGGVPQPHPQPHNTLSRASGTTGGSEFAPYAMNQWWYGQESQEKGEVPSAVWLDVYVVLDEVRLTAAELAALFDDIGRIGFGRDASIGLGKFRLEGPQAEELPHQANADAWLTLAPCAPQGQGFDPGNSLYQPFTRFGRHGDIGVHLPGGPFKAPLLLAQTGAVFSPAFPVAEGNPSGLSNLQENLPFFEKRELGKLFIGQGLGGDGSLSKTIEKTVHQGYAPVVGIRLSKARDAQ